jgi:hypothetical protein
MTDEDREWPLPPVVYRRVEEIEGDVQVQVEGRGRGEEPLPPPFVAPFAAREFPPSDAIPVDALPTVAGEPWVELEPPEAHPQPETPRETEKPLERSQEVTMEDGPLGVAPPGAAPEDAEDEEVVEEPPPAPAASPQEEVAALVERLALEIRETGGIQLEGGSEATPLEGLLRGMLAGYLAHVGKGPG